jgi:hypothetical protein
MNLQRAAMIVVVVGACAAWLASAATSGRRARVIPRAVDASPVDVRASDLASEIARLRERLTPAAAPRQPARNLFVFAAASPQPVVPAGSTLTDTVAAPAASTPAMPWQLVGIAEDDGVSGPVRTAIISGAGQLFLVKEGEAVTPQYRVSRIAADLVELVEASSGSSVRLVLK